MKEKKLNFNDLFEIKDNEITLKIDLIIKGEQHKAGEVVDYLDDLPDSPDKYYYLISNSKDGKVLNSKMSIR